MCVLHSTTAATCGQQLLHVYDVCHKHNSQETSTTHVYNNSESAICLVMRTQFVCLLCCIQCCCGEEASKAACEGG
jgi:hypothetical protein